MARKEIEQKYGFPLFSQPNSVVNLGKNEKLVISDIWSFWDYVIKKGSKDKKGEAFLRSLLEQAKHFYISAESSPVKSQPLLFYYSFLNLSKIMINLRGTFGESKMYMHGMSEKHNHKFVNSEVTKQKQKQQIVQVAHELVSLFDPHISSADIHLNAKSLLNHCVGVHRAYSEIYNQSEIFVRVKSAKLLKDGRELIYRAELACSSSDIAALSSCGYNIVQEGQGVFLEETYSMSTYTPKRGDYYALSQQIRAKGIWYFIGNSSYTMYLSKCPDHRYSQESIIYMIMFYLGSITRYHPYMFDQIFSDKEQWLMSEFLSTQPKQFLYLATANTLGQIVLKAYASF
ncbi:YaaC family protein [Vibrio parahaemolyticus]|uniref:YaaC family protein n=1 Tax=Vibrio parahaemolyticus TaxID=670 RepID=UPI002556B1C6|nr:YaaC family protein [Vibrio parahaemolyticus]